MSILDRCISGITELLQHRRNGHPEPTSGEAGKTDKVRNEDAPGTPSQGQALRACVPSKGSGEQEIPRVLPE